MLSGSEFVPILVLRDDRLGPASPMARSDRRTKTTVLGRYTLKIEELP